MSMEGKRIMQQEISIVANKVHMMLSGSMCEKEAATMKAVLSQCIEQGQVSYVIE